MTEGVKLSTMKRKMGLDKTKVDKSVTKYIPGSRIPFTFLLDYLKEGYTIHDFVSAYPWIKTNKLQKALEEVKKREFPSRYVI